MADNKLRINFNVTPAQKKEIVKLAKKENKSLTNFIVDKIFKEDDSQEEHQMNITEVENRYLVEKVDDLKRSYNELQDRYNNLEQRFYETHRAYLIKTQPFLKRIFSKNNYKELPNKED